MSPICGRLFPFSIRPVGIGPVGIGMGGFVTFGVGSVALLAADWSVRLPPVIESNNAGNGDKSGYISLALIGCPD